MNAKRMMSVLLIAAMAVTSVGTVKGTAKMESRKFSSKDPALSVKGSINDSIDYGKAYKKYLKNHAYSSVRVNAYTCDMTEYLE